MTEHKNQPPVRNEKRVQWICIVVCIIGALFLRWILGFEGVLYNVLFGAGGGAFGGLLAMIIVTALRGGKQD